jgi:hypothetical protein
MAGPGERRPIRAEAGRPMAGSGERRQAADGGIGRDRFLVREVEAGRPRAEAADPKRGAADRDADDGDKRIGSRPPPTAQ